MYTYNLIYYSYFSLKHIVFKKPLSKNTSKNEHLRPYSCDKAKEPRCNSSFILTIFNFLTFKLKQQSF